LCAWRRYHGIDINHKTLAFQQPGVKITIGDQVLLRVRARS
jgi:hypothetical protein